MIIISTILIVIGYLIRLNCIYQLKSNFSWRVRYPTNIIKTGLYKYVRHPMYLGGIILYSGLILLSSSNILLTLVMFIIFINFSIDRLDREEFLMIEKFPEEYINYMKKTKALIPFVF